MPTAPARPRARLWRGLCLAMACVLAGSGCAGKGSRFEPGPAFPDSLVQERTLDIHVLRDVRTIRLTNTTGEALPAGRLWLNKWFSREIPEGIAVGRSAAFDLGEFVDEFGEPFRGGGFFAGLDPDDLVLAQYEAEIDGQRRLLGLIVIDGRPQ